MSCRPATSPCNTDLVRERSLITAYHDLHALAGRHMEGTPTYSPAYTPAASTSLLSAMSGRGLILAQREVDAKTNEITVFPPPLAPLDLAGAVVTFAALHTQTEHARFLVEDKQAHYIALVKGNHPTLQRLLKSLPWKEVPLLDKTRATAHVRDRSRRMKTATVAKLPFPHAVQALHRSCATVGSWPPARSHRTHLRCHQPHRASGRGGRDCPPST